MSRFEDMLDMTESLDFMEGGSRDSITCQSPERKNSKYVKCYKCGGKAGYVDKCKQCHGRGQISQSHPMCQLLGDIISAKLPHLYPNVSVSLRQVCPIIQQSSEVNQKIIICDACHEECDNNSYSYCPQCKYYYLCNGCSQLVSKHEHMLIKINKVDDDHRCENCRKHLEEIILKCHDCEQNGILYQICSKCNQQRCHIHTSFYPHLLKKDNGKLGELQNSQGMSSQAPQDYFQSNNHILKNFELEKRGRVSDCVTSKNAAINEQSNNMRQSIIAIDCSMYNSCDYEQPNLIKQAQSEILDSQEQEPKISIKPIEYVFDDYICDRCQVGPIKNIRHHCLQCPDYDLCQRCYRQSYLQHKHIFKTFNGEQIINNKKEALRNVAIKFFNKCKKI